ncbi:MAG: coniferyl aldehyde dehydrogenase [Albidovulum sp.]
MIQDDISGLGALLDAQRKAQHSAGIPDLATRRADLAQLKSALKTRRADFIRAAAADFGQRSAEDTIILDLSGVVQGISYLHRHLHGWMRPERVWPGIALWPGRARIIRQPKGVIGIMSPWNYPFGLSLLPVATAIAAGNRAMVKPSEFAPASAALIAEVLSDLFGAEQVAVVQGGPEMGAAFASQPFDHLFYTGSTEIGRKVMQAAANNLVPVTLELGGKSPVILDVGADLDKAARDIAFGKIANGGQTCIAPDYVLVPKADLEQFTAALVAALERGVRKVQITGIISQRHADRLRALADEARSAGATVEGPGGGTDRVVMPAVIVGAGPDMRVMQEEIFGPLLPVLSYDRLEDAIRYVAARPHPLALYYYGPNGPGRQAVLAGTRSGNVTINGAMTHYAVEALPFGGIGASGMGAYHGRAGFDAMSHARGIYTEPLRTPVGLGRPGGRFAAFFARYLMR